MRKILLELVLIVAVFVAGWIGFAVIDWDFDSPEAEISYESEAKIGELIINDFLESASVKSNRTIDSAIFVIHNRLEEALGETNYDYKLHVVENDQVNAFATLDGNIVIYTGIIKFLDSPEELAAVLAHEIGHVEKRHVVSKLVKELGSTILMTVITGGDPALISEIMRNTISTVFDRKQETEADKFGLDLMEKAKISPVEMASAFRKIKKEFDTPYAEDVEFLMTHPSMNKRIKMALHYETKEGFTAESIDLDWERVQASVN